MAVAGGEGAASDGGRRLNLGQPSRRGNGNGTSTWVSRRGFACYDGTDCPAGETCGLRFEDLGTEGSVCMRRADVNHDGQP